MHKELNKVKNMKILYFQINIAYICNQFDEKERKGKEKKKKHCCCLSKFIAVDR